MKKRIMFMAYTDLNWMGGVYYVKNIVYQFLNYEPSRNKFDVFIYIDEKNKHIFEFCKEYDNVKFIDRKMKCGNRLRNKLVDLELEFVIWSNKIDYVYPDYDGKYISNPKMIQWIPDFQHVYLKDFFTIEEREKRDRIFYNIASKHNKLILSSRDAYQTYSKLYPDLTEGVYVVPFVSAIKQEDFQEESIDNILKKYNINNKDYFLVSNQFWQHKNHMCLIEAVEIVKEKYEKDIVVICTGYKNDLRKDEYFNRLMRRMEESGVQDNIKILGLIPRCEQLKIMESAIAVVQPSLFEGWGTVVEDAKTLGKIIVMSDIEVHKEQKDNRSILFSKESPMELAEILAELWDRYSGKSKVFNYGISKAKEYGKAFMDAIFLNEE